MLGIDLTFCIFFLNCSSGTFTVLEAEDPKGISLSTNLLKQWLVLG